MSRAILAIMAGLLCALGGVKYASSLKGDAQRLTRWVQLLRHLGLLLREGTLSIPEALCAAADGQQQPDKLLHALALAVRATPLLTLTQAFEQQAPSWIESTALARMFSRLGHGSQESRCLAVEQAADELRLLAEEAAARAEKDAKLWQTLGFIGGACMTIMLF